MAGSIREVNLPRSAPPQTYKPPTVGEVLAEHAPGFLFAPLYVPGTAVVYAVQTATGNEPKHMEGLATFMYGGILSLGAVGLLAWKGTREQQMAYAAASYAGFAAFLGAKMWKQRNY
jgi:hypothetical protein